MTKYIVRFKYRELYFANPYNGLVSDKRNAYRYTAEELKNHQDSSLIKKGAFVLIPVGEENEKER